MLELQHNDRRDASAMALRRRRKRASGAEPPHRGGWAKVKSEASRMDSATVILLFTDIEGSTQRWERNREAMALALRRHDEIMHAAITAFRGQVFKTVGDAFCATFATVPDALAAARQAQRELCSEDFAHVDGLAARIAIHAGAVEVRNDDYFGPSVNRIARLLDIAHGGQILLSGTAADLAAGHLPSDVELLPLGRYRLRDLEGAEHVYQLRAGDLRVDFPALKSLEDRPNNLPIQLTSFVGREQEIQDLATLLQSTRLLSLTGTGGVGKSRLALHLAADVLEWFPDGVWHVDLSLVRDGDAVAAEIAATLGVRVPPGQTVMASIALYVDIKRVLIILDGCEYVLGAAGAFAHAALQACANVSIIVTSRQALNIEGEVVHGVDTLCVEAACRLFAERAQAASSRFCLTEQNSPIITDICRRLDCIPLALELAAPKIVVLSPKQLLEKVDERFQVLTQTRGSRLPRQQTLRALIDWSFDLLDDAERVVLRKMSIFAGGCTLEAIAAVCGDERVDDWEVFDHLSSLISKSLVVMEPFGDGQRYRMLNSIRDYSLERLKAAGETESIAFKHATYFSTLTHGLHHLAETLEDVQWQQALIPELDNLRAIVARAFGGGNAAIPGLSMLSELEWPELITTPAEIVRWYEAALERIDAIEDSVMKARILRHYVRLQWLTGRSNEVMEKTAQAALAVAHCSGNANEIAHALANVGNVYRDADRFEEAEALYAKALEVPEALTPITRNAILRNFAVSNLQRGEEELARRRFTEVAQLERPGSETHASALLNLGELEFAVGNFEAARAIARQAKAVLQELNAAPLSLAICNLAAYALAVDDLEEAQAMLCDALALLKQSGARWLVTAFEHCALLAALRGANEEAAALAGFTDARYRSDGNTRQRTEKLGFERLQRLLTNVYGKSELDRRFQAGARLAGEQAFAHAYKIIGTAEAAVA